MRIAFKIRWFRKHHRIYRREKKHNEPCPWQKNQCFFHINRCYRTWYTLFLHPSSSPTSRINWRQCHFARSNFGKLYRRQINGMNFALSHKHTQLKRNSSQAHGKHTHRETRADCRTQNDSYSLIIVVIQEHCISSFYSIQWIMTLRQCDWTRIKNNAVYTGIAEILRLNRWN